MDIQHPAKKRRTMGTRLKLLIGVAGVLAVAHGRWPAPHEGGEARPGEIAAKSCETLLPSILRKIIAAQLRDPDSAKFGDAVVTCDVQIEGKPITAVCGSVNSKNGFGGYSGPRSYVFAFGVVEVPAKPKTWNRYCAGSHARSMTIDAWMLN